MNEIVTLVQQITGVCMIEESNEQVIFRLNAFDQTEWSKWLAMYCELSASSWNVYQTYSNLKRYNFSKVLHLPPLPTIQSLTEHWLEDLY